MARAGRQLTVVSHTGNTRSMGTLAAGGVWIKRCSLRVFPGKVAQVYLGFSSAYLSGACWAPWDTKSCRPERLNRVLFIHDIQFLPGDAYA